MSNSNAGLVETVGDDFNSPYPAMTFRQTLRGNPIPPMPPPKEEWKYPEDMLSKLPSEFKNGVVSIENVGAEFSHYMKKYQFDDYTPYSTMSALLASWQLLEQNLRDLKDAITSLKLEEREKAGGEEGMRKIWDAFRYIEYYVEPYRQGMGDLAMQGILNREEDRGEM